MRRLTSTLLLVGCLTACRASPELPHPYRLVDHTTASAPAYLVIDGLKKRILEPGVQEHAFTLTHVPPRPVLSFAVGLEPRPLAATVRFEIRLDPPSGEPVTLYQKDLGTPGWVDERIDLPSHDLEGARLVLRKQLLAGPKHRLLQSAWGDPVLLPSKAANHPSVILISIDTLRADRVGLYGYAQARTPTLDALGRNGVWYKEAYSPSTWTVPSHASLFYGRYLAGVPVDPTAQGDAPVPPDQRLRPLAEIFREAGYLTAGFTGGGFMSDAFGFPGGFDTYYMFPPAVYPQGQCPPERFDGPEVFRRATAWLHDRGHVPFFLFIHTYDVHDRCPARGPDPKPFEAWPALTPEKNERLLAFYDDLIAGVDARVGALLAELDRLGLANDTLVVVTSDHGEFFSEHGFRGHGGDAKPYEEVVRVPLLLRDPAGLKERACRTEPVSLIDVAPTILALTGLPHDPGMEGGVLPGVGRRGGTATRPVYVAWEDLLAVRQGPLKLIASEKNRFAREVYDVEEDRTERHNLTWRRAKVDKQLYPLAEAYWKARAANAASARTPDIDDKTREWLHALGYGP